MTGKAVVEVFDKSANDNHITTAKLSDNSEIDFGKYSEIGSGVDSQDLDGTLKCALE